MLFEKVEIRRKACHFHTIRCEFRVSLVAFAAVAMIAIVLYWKPLSLLPAVHISKALRYAGPVLL
jgi:hypothetical protein